MNYVLSRIVLATCLMLPAVAHAERIQTYWKLSAPDNQFDGVAANGKILFEHRLLPARLVRLTAPVDVDGQRFEAGTFLFMVFNDAGRTGFCPVKDGSAGRQLATLFVPILNKRPCLVDADEDGRFDRYFAAFDKYGGPPTVRGSIDAAVPIAGNIPYQSVDPSLFPVDIRMAYRLRGSNKKLLKANLQVEFTGPVKGTWQTIHGTRLPSETVFQIGNVEVRLQPASNGEIVFTGRSAPDFYIYSDNRNNLFWDRLPNLSVQR